MSIPNPFQVKYIPFLIALLLGVVCGALTHSAYSFVICAALGATTLVAAGEPLYRLMYHGFIWCGAALIALSIFALFYRLWASAGFHALFAALPISIVCTRRPKE